MTPTASQKLFNTLANPKSSIANSLVNFYKEDLGRFFAKNKGSAEYYISQLEKNIPYHKFTYNHYSDYLVTHILNPTLRVDADVFHTEGRRLALIDNESVQIYFSGGVPKNPNLITDDIKNLKALKDAGKNDKATLAKFLEEAEFQIIYYKALTAILQSVMALFAEHREIAEDLSKEYTSYSEASNMLLGVSKAVKDQSLLMKVPVHQYFSKI